MEHFLFALKIGGKKLRHKIGNKHDVTDVFRDVIPIAPTIAKREGKGDMNHFEHHQQDDPGIPTIEPSRTLMDQVPTLTLINFNRRCHQVTRCFARASEAWHDFRHTTGMQKVLGRFLPHLPRH